MLTPPVLNRIPRGVLSFFGIKNGGRNPQSLAGQLVPTIDLWDHYIQSNTFAQLFGPVAMTAIGANNFTLAGANVVAPGRGVFVSRYSVSCTVPAGTICSLVPTVELRLLGGTRQSFAVGPAALHQGTAASEVVIAPAAGPFWMPPDSAVGFVVTRYSGVGPANIYGLADAYEVEL